MTGYINKDNVLEAFANIQAHISNTPLIESQTLSRLAGCTTLFKLENLQMTGSFKERGALNKLLSLNVDEKKRGVIAASAGNHAQALAYHASRQGVSVKIVMPEHSPIVKVKSTQHWGAEVILTGASFDDAMAHSKKLVADEGRVFIHPFDDPLIAAGQGTVGVELLNHLRGGDIDAILVPVGGGGLISGIAAFVKETNPNIKVIGVEEAGGNGMYRALQEGRPVLIDRAPLIADGIAVREVSGNNLKIVNAYVDEVVTVSSDEVANAIMLMLEIEKLVVEGAAAAPLAALINNRLPQLKGKTVVSIVSGGNIDVNHLSKIIDRGLVFDGRVARLQTVIEDRPGNLENLMTVFRESGANILEVNHTRLSPRAPVGQVEVTVTIETKDKEHLADIEKSLKKSNYSL